MAQLMPAIPPPMTRIESLIILPLIESLQRLLECWSNGALEYWMQSIWTVDLDFCYNDRIRLAHRSARQASQAVLRPDRNGLVWHFEHIHRTHLQTFLTRITFVRIHVNQINFIISYRFGHRFRLNCNFISLNVSIEYIYQTWGMWRGARG